MDKNIEMLKQKIDKASSICILSHTNPDGDSLGSSMALCLALEQLNKKVAIFVDDTIHSNFSFLNIDKRVNISNQDIFDLCFVLDCPEIKRVDKVSKYFDNSKDNVNIDHHPDNTNFSNLYLGGTNYSSTCLVLCEIFDALNINITTEIATCLYTGIATDTGCFVHDCTDEKSHVWAGKMISYGAVFYTVNYIMFSKKTKKQTELFAEALHQVKYSFNDQVAIICLTQKMMNELDACKDDSIGFVGYINSIECVKLAIVMQEQRPNVFLVSVRSRDLSAQNVAKKLGGGGHIKASGCKIFKSKNTAIKLLEDACKAELERTGNWKD